MIANADTKESNTEDISLEEALSEGSLDKLPPNQPKGLLGERGFNLYDIETHRPDLNAGVLQENDGPVIRMAVVLGFLLFPPVGYWLLWKTNVFTRLQTWVIGVLGTAWLLVLLWVLVVR